MYSTWFDLNIMYCSVCLRSACLSWLGSLENQKDALLVGGGRFVLVFTMCLICSQAYQTKHRRKCDLAEPSCLKCSQNGRICEGYARYPVFLNRNAQGLEKRRPLEEAKTSPSSQQARLQRLVNQPDSNFQRAMTHSRGASDNRILIQPSTFTLLDQQVISSFYEKYVPSYANAQNDSYSPWLRHVIDLPKPKETIYYSLKALAMTRLGWIHGDISLTSQGYECYGRGLQALQKSILDNDTMYEDAILAAGHILSIYEARDLASH